LEEIVWALRPGSDSVQSLIEYIAHFAKELFEGNRTQCRLDLPDELPNQPLPPEMRHNVFLIIKEALTNVFKHAHAHEVLVQARVDRAGLQLVVADDGAGCQLPTSPGASTRNGLGNMQRRAEAMGGTLQIVSAPGQGTRVTVHISLPSVGMNQLRAHHDLPRTTR
jgi:signal transduction histidine kinase